jgi:hypothetical protein
MQSQAYLRMLQDEARNATASTTAAAASQFHSGLQMGFTGLPMQPDESGRIWAGAAERSQILIMHKE